MTQEEKQLLLKDLCARLPYGVKIYTQENGKNTSFTLTISDLDWIFEDNRIDALYEYDGWKPYLRPMSSMTEDEMKEVNHFLGYRKDINRFGDIRCAGWNGDTFVDIDIIDDYVDWLNSNHFDHRGLIEKGLALEAPEGMYNF